MLRYLGLLILGLALPFLLVATPAAALTSKQKMETCRIGAKAQKLTGAKRNAFIKRCMAKGNYEPPARRALKTNATKKPAAKQN